MDENEWLADRFEEHRAHLRAVAYRMLGSLAEADDAVQDTWLRLSRSGAGRVENLGGWLTTIVARVCLNMLRSRNLRREESFGVHVPDPVVGPESELSELHELTNTYEGVDFYLIEPKEIFDVYRNAMERDC